MGEGAAVDIGFNNINYLSMPLATLSSNEITIALRDSSASALLFTVPGRTDFGKYVVMPMRI